MTKHTQTHTESTLADPCEPAAQTAGPGSLTWSLSQHFWLMSDFFPTTYYGNITDRDEELRLCSCSAQLADPTKQGAIQSQCLLLKVDFFFYKQHGLHAGMRPQEAMWMWICGREKIYTKLSWTLVFISKPLKFIFSLNMIKQVSHFQHFLNYKIFKYFVIIVFFLLKSHNNHSLMLFHSFFHITTLNLHFSWNYLHFENT